jgi:SWI/SNF-related matrix-associated actin-dependent regulator of chromatin subfamily A member 5
MSEDADESIITASGKMVMLDRLLKRLKAGGHRAVIFSQFTRMLDIVDDYMRLRGHPFVRLDGGTSRVQRTIDIQEFNKPESRYFAFLMSTRAGGLGINAQTADTVILLDSDWNPQVDLQAMARVHRIGQTKTVHVYRLVSRGTMEERIVQRAQKKLFLDVMVNRGSTAQAEQMEKLGVKEMLSVLSFGFDRVFDSQNADQVRTLSLCCLCFLCRLYPLCCLCSLPSLLSALSALSVLSAVSTLTAECQPGHDGCGA